MDSMKRQKDMMSEDKPLQARRCPNMLLVKEGGQLPLIIAPVRMKQLGQSRNDAKLWVFGGESKV